MRSRPLQGKAIGVTRPRAQAEALAKSIAAQGGQPVLFPLLKIDPIDQAADLAALDAAIVQLEVYTLAIFVSPNAVDFGVPAILAQGPWPPALSAAAIGASSVAALVQHGITHVIAPQTRFDSEALLELPALQAGHVAGRRVVIFRGNGGRELLATSLRERGATVDCVSCYQRSADDDGVAALIAWWASNPLDALTISSSESLRHLLDRLDATGYERLRITPVFVPHRRIAELATVLGLRYVIATEPADAGIISGLCAYNWQRP